MGTNQKKPWQAEQACCHHDRDKIIVDVNGDYVQFAIISVPFYADRNDEQAGEVSTVFMEADTAAEFCSEVLDLLEVEPQPFTVDDLDKFLKTCESIFQFNDRLPLQLLEELGVFYVQAMRYLDAVKPTERPDGEEVS